VKLDFSTTDAGPQASLFDRGDRALSEVGSIVGVVERLTVDRLARTPSS
jgi:hypothetical protein